MSFKTRNTLIILAFALLISGFTIYINLKHYPGKIDALNQQIASMDQYIVQLPEREEYLKQVNAIIEEKRELLSGLDKTIEPNITLAEAFDYLDDIQDRYGSLKFALNSLKEVSASGYGYRSFQLTGEGSYRSIYSMIYALERGPKMFVIDDVNLRGVEAGSEEGQPPEVVTPFDLKIRALYADVPELPPLKRTLKDVRVPWSDNLFWPIIAKALPPNTKGLLEAERSELRALLPGKAVLVDHMGKIHVLKEGDEVYLGYLTKIDVSNNRVEFTLNKGGIVERYRLTLPFPSAEESYD